MPYLYTTECKLIEICREGGIWYDIVQKLKEIYICNNSSTDEWEDKSNSFLLALHRAQTSVFVDNEFFKDIKKDIEYVKELYNPIYILDYSKDEAKEISDKYGIIFLPSDDTPVPSFVQPGWSIDTSDETKPNKWDYILKDLSIPIHSVIIVDRYIFSNEPGETINDSIFNLTEILSSLLKQTSAEELTISIVFDGKKSSLPIKELANKVNSIKEKVSYSKPFNLELISINSDCYNYDQTHDRFIISDYFIVDARHKIKAFRKNGRSLCKQNITFEYIFSKGLGNDTRSSVPMISQERVLNALLESLKKSKGKMLYAINGQHKKAGDFSPVNDLLLRDYD